MFNECYVYLLFFCLKYISGNRSNLFVTADDLPVRVLDCRHVRVTERSAHEAQHQRTLSDTARAEHDHAVVVALLRHCVLSPPPMRTCSSSAYL